MIETRVCATCGTEIPADAAAGQCPQCMLQVGLESAASNPEFGPTALSPSASFEPLPIEKLAEQFPNLEILELLGQGGMGAVYKARQPGLDRMVALKILPPEVGAEPAFTERFTREARALARLSHPNIVTVYDFGQTHGLYYFLMEFIDGVNLRQALQAGSLSPGQALAIVPQICDALQFAHDEGIVHRDIKPENILLDKKGRVKIADFGLAKLLGREQADVSLTGTHQVMGTLRYMAPEQMEGTKAVDHRADIYSLGVVFYELLTGQLPLGRFDPPSHKVQIDVRLDEVVLRALAQEPDRRYQQASQIKTDLEAMRNRQSPGTFALTGAQEEVVATALRTDKIKAIRLYRELTGASLADSKASVEDLGRRLGITPPSVTDRQLLWQLGMGSLVLVLILQATTDHRASSTTSGATSVLAIVASVMYVGFIAFAVFRRRKPESRHSRPNPLAAAPPSAASSLVAANPKLVLVIGGMLMMSALTVIAGGVIAGLAFIFATPGGGPFWGWMGGAFGCILGGLGSLVGCMNSYRQLCGGEDLLQSRHWTWFDTAITAIGVIGAAILLFGVFLAFTPAGITPTVHATSLGGSILLFQALIFSLIRWPFRS